MYSVRTKSKAIIALTSRAVHNGLVRIIKLFNFYERSYNGFYNHATLIIYE